MKQRKSKEEEMSSPTSSEASSKATATSNGSSSASSSSSEATGHTVISSFKLMLLVMMVLQNSSCVLVGRYTRAGIPKEDQYQVNHLLFVIEFSKLLASCALEHYTSGGKLISHLQMHVLDKPLDALKITIPALLYLFQNTLLYVALENLTAPIFQVTYQFKLVTTAIMSVVMLQRKYSMQQWICLVMISFGVAMVVLGEKKEATAEQVAAQGHTNLFVGLIAVTCACVSSALAGVYFEKVLKKPAQTHDDAVKTPPPSLWMRNIQLAFYSVLIAAAQGWWQKSSEPTGQAYLHGFNAWTWTLVALQAGGGLLVAAVIKYADNVLKGLATGVSVVLSSALSMLLFSTPLGMKFVVGACLILTAVWFFSNPLPEPLHRLLLKKESEMTGTLLPK